MSQEDNVSEVEETQLEENVDTNENVNEESVDEETSETEDKDTTDDDSQDESNEDDLENEEWESEEEYLNQFELPGNPKSVDDVVKNYKGMLVEMKRMQGKERELEPRPTPNQTELNTQERESSYFEQNPFNSAYEKLLKDGSISDENKDSYRSIATFNDKALSPFVAKAEAAMNELASGMMQLHKSVKEMQWNNFSKGGKELVDRDVLEGIMKSEGISDYQKALYHHVINDRPDLLDKLKGGSGNKGANKKGNKKFKKFSSNRRSKQPAGTKKVDGSFKNYVNKNGDLDQTKLNRLPTEKALEITEKYIASLE